MADTLVLGSSEQSCEFKSRYAHHEPNTVRRLNMNDVFYVDQEIGMIVHRDSGIPVVEPAILFDADCGTLHGAGSYESLEKKYQKMMKRLEQSGIKWNLIFIRLADTLSLDEQCYVLRRCIETSASQFPLQLYRHFNDGDALEWLRSEMERVKI